MAKVIILSGAGISAQSGIRTFRDTDGLWEEHSIEDICTAGCLEKNYKATLDFYDKRRMELHNKQPNHAHKTIALLKQKYPDKIAVITQNVDDMFEKANCPDVLHLHGFLKEIKCQNKECDYLENINYEAQNKQAKCPKCSAQLRPNIVFFGEEAPMYQPFFKAFDDCEMLVVIGTSGYVINTDMFLNPDIKLSILNNLEKSDALDETLYTKALFKKATDAIDEIAWDIENFLQ
ncbi:MAG: Sir2 family NAD-dependent protein deacetylase [Arcobacteraceae bacterium]